jgi:hypothetical protein
MDDKHPYIAGNVRQEVFKIESLELCHEKIKCSARSLHSEAIATNSFSLFFLRIAS